VVEKFNYLARSSRPYQWIKNLGCFTAIIFTGQLFNQTLFINTLLAFFIFCGLSSATYLFNDVLDIEKDRLHPLKKERPIAKGKISIPEALIAAAIFALISLFLALTFLPQNFFALCLTFLFLQISYSLFFRNVVLMDIFLIAGGYVLRVLAGEFATGWHISVWLLLCVVSLSLFLAVGKRRSELSLLQGLGKGISATTRSTLFHYPEKLLDIYTSMVANSTWITYSFYTFLEPGPRLKPTVTEFLLRVFPWGLERKWMMVTIPIVMYGIMRYLHLIYEQQKGEAPEKALLSDKPLMGSVFLWGTTVVGIIYIIGG
jgi:decaprenyl-phosphate phosphoribosyltransferase